MFAAFEILGFCVAIVAAFVLRRRNPMDLFRLAVWGANLTLAFAFVIGWIGIPLFLYRFGHLEVGQRSASVLARLHLVLGHVFITLFVVFWPFLLAASVTRAASMFRKIALAVAAVVTLILFLFVAFTGYALPDGMPRTLARSEAPAALRFVVLHVIAGPLLAGGLLAALRWRNARAESR